MGGILTPPPFLPHFFYDYLCEICSKVANIEEKITLTQFFKTYISFSPNLRNRNVFRILSSLHRKGYRLWTMFMVHEINYNILLMLYGFCTNRILWLYMSFCVIKTEKTSYLCSHLLYHYAGKATGFAQYFCFMKYSITSCLCYLASVYKE